MSRNSQLLRLLQDTQVLTPPRPVLVADPMMHPPAGDGAGRGAFRALAQRLFLALGTDAALRSVLFCSIERRNRLAIISARVAQALATIANLSLCLLDANLRSPTLHEVLARPNRQGLSDFLRQPSDLRGLIQHLDPTNLWFLPAGPPAANVDSLIFSDRMRICLADLRSQFDCVLIQAPPIDSDEEAVWMGRLTDGVILVLEAGVSRRDDAERAKQSFDAAGVKVLGAVLNSHQSPIPEVLERLF